MYFCNFPRFYQGPNNLPNANFNSRPRLPPSNVGYQGLDITLNQIGGNSTLTSGPLANVDMYLPNGRKSCQTLQNSTSHYIRNSLQRCHHGKMLGTTSFHILWSFRPAFSLHSYGIVVVVFQSDSGRRKAKK